MNDASTSAFIDMGSWMRGSWMLQLNAFFNQMPEKPINENLARSFVFNFFYQKSFVIKAKKNDSTFL